MDKNTLLLIFILFLLSSQLLSITWDIGKASVYIVIILLILNSISPETATTIKNIFSRIINLDFSLITSGLSTVSKFILSLFFKNNGPQIIDEVKNALKEEIIKVKSESPKGEEKPKAEGKPKSLLPVTKPDSLLPDELL
jgi:hypothetical protein